MPLGILVNTGAIILGGMIGSVFGSRISEKMKTTLNQIFGLCAMMMGITSIVQVQNMPPVILAMILGTAAGILLKLGDRIEKGAVLMQKGISRFSSVPEGSLSEEEYTASLLILDYYQVWSIWLVLLIITEIF